MSLLKFMILLFVALAVIAPWAIPPFIDGVGEMFVAIRDGVESIRESN